MEIPNIFMDVSMDLSAKDSWYRFYGCFQKTSFNWSCKEFSQEKDATNFTIVNNSMKLPTLLIPINYYIPKLLDNIIVEKKIKDVNKICFY